MRSSIEILKSARISATNQAHDRLQNILGPRITSSSQIDSTEIIYEPPPETFRPIAKLVTAAVLAIAFLAWLNRPQAIAAPVVEQTGQPVAGASAPAINGEIVVDVEGLVNQPGLVTLAVGSRVADAVAAAGGISSPEAAGSINLAQRVVDGQLISIGASAGEQTDAKININQANATELDGLPGVGPVMADRIIKWREAHQQFTSIEELQEVPGIGSKVFANLKDLISI